MLNAQTAHSKPRIAATSNAGIALFMAATTLPIALFALCLRVWA